MSQETLVSIIIPTYNAERFLSQTLDSVLAQTRPDWNLIIIDDGSKDGTLALAETFAAKDERIRVAPYPNGGVVVARNRGFAESKPEIPYLAYLDHDDLWDANFLETLLIALEADPKAVGAHGVARFIDADGEPCKAFDGMTWPRERLRIMGKGVAPAPENAPTSFAVEAVINCIATPGQTLLRRAAVEKAGLFRPDTNPCDDWDLYLRLTQQGDILFINKIIMGWRQHDANVSKDWDRVEKMMLYVRRKILAESKLDVEHRRMLLTGYRHTQKAAARRWLQSAQDCLQNRRFVRALNHLRFAGTACAYSFYGRPR